MKAWIEFIGKKPKFKNPIAILGAPGLRSVGKIAIDHLIRDLKPELFAELYSPNFPVVYYFSPSYVGTPGEAGTKVENGVVELPKIKFYSHKNLIIVKGYQADFYGQYDTALKVLDFLEKFGVKKIIVLGGHARGVKGVHCVATNPEIVEEMKKFGIEKSEEGPFYGFSGLVLGLSMLKDMKGICLLGMTAPNFKNPEHPDPLATKTLLDKLSEILKISINTSELEVEEKEEPLKKIPGYA